MRLAAPPARWLVLTTLRARTGEHLRKVARHAVAKGAHLVLAYYEGQHPNGLVDPLARLAQRARFLRRRLGVCVDLVDGVLRSRRDLLALVEGVEVFEPARVDECCGFGGMFAVEEKEVSVCMGRDKVRDHMATGAEYITGADSSCLMHMQGVIDHDKLPIRTIHAVEILNSKL